MSTAIKLGFVPGDRSVFSTAWALQMRDRCVTALRKLEQVELVLPDPAVTTKGLVSNITQAHAVARQFKSQGVTHLLLGTMNFGDEVAMSEIARQLAVPTLLFGTPDAVLSDGKRAGSDSFCGTLSVAMNLHVALVPFTFAGIVDPAQPAFLSDVKQFLSTAAAELQRKHQSNFTTAYRAPNLSADVKKIAASAATKFRNVTLGQFGPRANGFVTCAYDERQLLQHFGQRVVPIDLATIFGRAHRVSAESPEYAAAHALITSKTKVEVGPQSIDKIVRLYVALKSLIDGNHIVALGHNCWTGIQTDYGICGCAVFSFLEDEGTPIACETDVYGAVSMYLQKCVAQQLGQTRPPFFMDWTIQHPTDADLFQAWHCGKAPVSTFAEKPAIRSHEILGPLLGDAVSGGTLEGAFQEGPVTLVRLVEYGGKFRALVTRGVIEPSPWKHMRGSWGWVRVSKLNQLYRTLVEKGFSHHVSMMYGDHTQATAATCEALGMEVVWH